MSKVSNADKAKSCRREKLSLNDYQQDQRNILDPLLQHTYGVEDKQIATLIASFLPVMPARDILPDPAECSVTCCTISADSQYIAAAYRASPPVLKLWNVITGTCEKIITMPIFCTPVTTTCQLSPDGQTLLAVHQTVDDSYYMRIWNISTWGNIDWDIGFTDVMECVLVSSEKVVSMWENSEDEVEIDIWDIRTDTNRTITGRNEIITQFCVTNHGHSIAYLMEDHLEIYRRGLVKYKVKICDINTTNVLYSLTSGHFAPYGDWKLLANTDRVVLWVYSSLPDETTVQSWDAATGVYLTESTHKEVTMGDGELDKRMSAQLSSDGERVLRFGDNSSRSSYFGSVYLEELSNGRIQKHIGSRTHVHPTLEITCFAMPPTEQFVVTGNTTGELHLWDPMAGLLINWRNRAKRKKVQKKKRVIAQKKEKRKAIRKTKKKA